MRKNSLEYDRWLVQMNKRIWSKVGGKNVRAYVISRPNEPEYPSPIYLPDIISLDTEDNLKSLTLAVEQIRENVTTKFFSPIDFRPIRKITPSGALVIAAELDRMRRKRKMRLKPWFECEWHPDVKKVFSDFNLYKLLKIHRNQKALDLDSTKCLPLVFGRQAMGLKARVLRKNLQMLVGMKLEKQQWYIALTEAMTNVAQHAYRDNNGDIYNSKLNIYQSWWLSGTYDTASNLLTVMFYDQGITIPRSLPFSYAWDAVKHFLKHGASDAELIKAAFDAGRSRTKESHRGKGVQQLLDPLQGFHEGELQVISRHGVCHVKKHDKNIVFTLNNYEPSFEGTFIEWKLYLPNGD